MEPEAMEVIACPSICQNCEDPQVAQKPRRPCAELAYQRSACDPVMVSRAVGTAVADQSWPDVLRHWLQWQA